MSDPIVEVAVDAPLLQTLSYLVPNDMQPHRGDLVEVPLAKRRVQGVVIRRTEAANIPIEKLRTVGRIIEPKSFSEEFLQWLEWLARYYVHPIGQVMGLASPPLPRSKRKPTTLTTNTLDAQPSTSPTLTEEQQMVLKNIPLDQGYAVHVLHGVTGSGKTEVYMQLFAQIMERGGQGLLLVPEISLTPQLLNRFSNRFPDQIAVIHSHLTPRQKTDQWFEMIDGTKKILIGARSALFCPIPNLKLIVIDEEHESSFKQDEKLKYHARDAAVKAASLFNIPIVLGSATPSLETWYNCLTEKYCLHEMKARVEDRALPDVSIVDLKQQAETPSVRPQWMSEQLFQSLIQQNQRGEQSALFLNRRGIARALFCQSCGHHFSCPNCSVGLTLHGVSSLLCHYCAYVISAPEVCPACKDGEPKPWGVGTEQIERDILGLFPGIRVLRMDRDEIQSRQDLENSIRKIETGEIDILIGTQMIAKGLDFPKLTLVGVVLADSALEIPDFRASEKAFQLLTQVAGRSGRHLNDRNGLVIIQTFNPDHASIRYASQHDYRGFAESELRFRNDLGYPPIGRVSVIRVMSGDSHRTSRMAKSLYDRAVALRLRDIYKGIGLLGPAPCPISKIRNQYRWQILVKGPNAMQISSYCRQLTAKTDWLESGVKVLIDIDAVNLL